ncbi:MAG: 2TM domain-containing protein [Bacteroidia bacterium]|nr:2TM domain-containing protein [Bacteroidia bacterium]
MDEYQIEAKARQLVRAKKFFYVHLIFYLAVSIFLVVINVMTAPWVLWSVYPTVSWGLLVVAHYLVVHFLIGSNASEWERKQLAKEQRRLEDIADDAEDDRLELSREHPALRAKERAKREWDDGDLV